MQLCCSAVFVYLLPQTANPKSCSGYLLQISGEHGRGQNIASMRQAAAKLETYGSHRDEEAGPCLARALTLWQEMSGMLSSESFKDIAEGSGLDLLVKSYVAALARLATLCDSSGKEILKTILVDHNDATLEKDLIRDIDKKLPIKTAHLKAAGDSLVALNFVKGLKGQIVERKPEALVKHLGDFVRAYSLDIDILATFMDTAPAVHEAYIEDFVTATEAVVDNFKEMLEKLKDPLERCKCFPQFDLNVRCSGCLIAYLKLCLLYDSCHCLTACCWLE
jgi:hypothetical protein